MTGRVPSVGLDETLEKALQQAALWDEVKDRLGDPGIGLSGGQQQRLCIARALAVNPDVLLMDEPCSALDPIATAKIEDLIHTLKQSYTIVIVTHSMQQAARVSDQTAFFLSGDLIELDSTGLPPHAARSTAIAIGARRREVIVTCYHVGSRQVSPTISSDHCASGSHIPAFGTISAAIQARSSPPFAMPPSPHDMCTTSCAPAEVD